MEKRANKNENLVNTVRSRKIVIFHEPSAELEIEGDKENKRLKSIEENMFNNILKNQKFTNFKQSFRPNKTRKSRKKSKSSSKRDESIQESKPKVMWSTKVLGPKVSFLLIILT